MADLHIILKELRTKSGIGQAKAAEIAGVSKGTYLNWEYNKCLPAVDGLAKLMTYYDASLDEVLGIKKPASSVNTLNSDEEGYIKAIRSLTPSAKDAVISYLLRLTIGETNEGIQEHSKGHTGESGNS